MAEALQLLQAEQRLAGAFGSAAAAPKPDETKLRAAVQAAHTRAYQVAWALRNPDARAAYHLRKTLSWIAISGEDDPPARPVNVPSGIQVFAKDGTTLLTAYPQYELPVTVPGTHVTFQTRYTVANVQDR
jgi:hypothetical protein